MQVTTPGHLTIYQTPDARSYRALFQALGKEKAQHLIKIFEELASYVLPATAGE